MVRVLQRLHYKELYLAGFYISFIGITSLASVIDCVIGKYFDCEMDLLFVTIAAGFFWTYFKYRNYDVAAAAIFWIASILVFIFVVNSQFDISIIFTLMLPIVAFLLMSVRQILYHVTLYFLILVSLFIYGYHTFENHHYLHNIASMSALFIAALFVIAFGVFYHYAIEASRRELEKANAQKEMLLKEIHHRIKNNLNIISSILGLQKLESSDPVVHRLVEQNRMRIDSMSLAHEILYKNDDLSSIDFQTYMERLIEQILIISAHEKHIQLAMTTEKTTFYIDVMIKLGIIINELVTNSIKYAFKNSEGTIWLTLQQGSEGYIMTYTDSGEERVDLQMLQQSDTLGLNLVKLTVEQMHGDMSIDATPALRYIIKFKA